MIKITYITYISQYQVTITKFSLRRYLITDDKISRRTVLIISLNFESDRSQFQTKILVETNSQICLQVPTPIDCRLYTANKPNLHYLKHFPY